MKIKCELSYDGGSFPFHIILLNFWCPFAFMQEGFQR